MTYVPPPPPPPPPAPSASPVASPIANPAADQLDFAKPFTYVFDDPRWMQKILIGGLFYLAGFFIIGWFFVLGYMARTARNIISDQPNPLPEWDDLGEYFNDGLRLVGVVLLYILPVVALVILLMVPPIVLSSVDNEAAQFFGSTIAGCIWCVMVPLSLAIVIFMPASLLFAAVERRTGAGFDFARIWPFIKNNIGNYLLAVVVYLVARFLGGFGIMLLCVGVIFTAFWAMLITTHAFAQVYRIATRANR